MGLRGPAPQPTNLKLLRGNPGRRPLNKHEARPAAKLPSCPPELPAAAKKEWKRISKLLFTVGLLTELDRAALAGYCLAYSRWLEAEEEVQKTGPIIKTKAGYPVLNPYLRVSHKAFEQMFTAAAQFGMTPSTRSRIEVKPLEEDTDPMDKYRQKRRNQ